MTNQQFPFLAVSLKEPLVSTISVQHTRLVEFAIKLEASLRAAHQACKVHFFKVHFYLIIGP
jgi:hypothetical protein